MKGELRAPGRYASAGSPRIGDRVTIDGGATVFRVWAQAPDRGQWWVVPDAGGHAIAVHWKALVMA